MTTYRTDTMIGLILTVALVGFLVWAIVTYVPMPQGFKTAICIIAIVCVVFYVAQAFGLIGHVHDVPVPSLR